MLDKALVLCVGTTTDLSAQVVHSAGHQVLVMVVPDTENAIRILQQARSPGHQVGSAVALETERPWTEDRAAVNRPELREASVALAPATTAWFGRLWLDPERRQAFWGSAQFELSARQFDLLATLASSGDRVWSYAELTAAVWQRTYIGDSDAVASAVKRLRRRLATVTPELLIRSVRGVGYRLVLQQNEDEQPAAILSDG